MAVAIKVRSTKELDVDEQNNYMVNDFKQSI